MIFGSVKDSTREPQPGADAGRVVMLWGSVGARDRVQVSAADFADWRELSHAFEGVAAFVPGKLSLTQGGEPEQVARGSVSASFFSVLGVKPVLGRDFFPEEDRPGKGQVVILSNGLWQRRFNSDPGIVGKAVSINHAQYTVVGVLPQDFQFPRGGEIPPGFRFPQHIEAWTPLAFEPTQLNRSFRFLTVVARLKPNVSLEQAQADMDSVARRLKQQYPRTNGSMDVKVVPVR